MVPVKVFSFIFTVTVSPFETLFAISPSTSRRISGTFEAISISGVPIFVRWPIEVLTFVTVPSKGAITASLEYSRFACSRARSLEFRVAESWLSVSSLLFKALSLADHACFMASSTVLSLSLRSTRVLSYVSFASCDPERNVDSSAVRSRVRLARAIWVALSVFW